MDDFALLPDPMRNRLRDFWIDWLHLATLNAFAVAQPVFDVLSGNQTFFTARDFGGMDLPGLLLVLMAGLPVLMGIVLAAAFRFNGRCYQFVHSVFILIPLSFIFLLFINQGFPQLDGWLILFLGLSFGLGATCCYCTRSLIKNLMTWLSPAILIFPLLFLLGSPFSKSVLPSSVQGLEDSPEIQAGTPVVMIVWDEFPLLSLLDHRHQVDPVRYPHFAALAKEATWYRRAVTVSDYTNYAVPAIITGLYPKQRREPLLEDYPRNLFTLLGRSYTMHAYQSGTQLCPEGVCRKLRYREQGLERIQSLVSDLLVIYLHLIIPDDLQGGLPSINGTWGNFADPDRGRETKADAFDAFLGALSDHPPDQSGRTLYYLQIEMPHRIWDHLPSGKVYDPEDTGKMDYSAGFLPGTYQWADETSAIHGHQRHLLQVGYVDGLMGKIIARLKSSGVYDKALIIITADHGIGFNPGRDARLLDRANAADVLPVPLIIKYPYQKAGRVDDAPVETVDILPTVARVLKLENPWPMEGQDLSSSRQARRKFYRIYTVHQQYLEFPVKYFWQHFEQRLQEKFSRFGSGASRHGEKTGVFYPDIPNQELVGKSPESFAIQKAVGNVKVRLLHPQFYRYVDLKSSFLPARLVAEIQNEKAPGSDRSFDLALALNDSIVAVTRNTHKTRGSDVAAWMIPEEAFHAGENSVRIFRIDREKPGQPVLTQLYPAAAKESEYQLQEDGTPQIRTPQGRLIPIDESSMSGHVQLQPVETAIESNHLLFAGWAIASQRDAQPEKIVVFSGGRYFDETEIQQDSEVIAGLFGEQLRHSGFLLYVPRYRLPYPDRAGLRFFVVSDQAATELKFRQE